MITGISLIESTAYITAFSPLLLIFPIPKLFFIDSNKDRSLTCKVIEKTGLTLQLVFNLAFCCIFIVKQPSASVKPVKNQGFISGSDLKFKVENDVLFY
jgi:hypothetical protein